MINNLINYFKEFWNALTTLAPLLEGYWYNVIIIVALYTLLIIFIVKLFYKRSQENVNSLKAVLKEQQRDLDNKMSEYLIKKQDLERSKRQHEEELKVIKSKEYEAFLISREHYKNDLDDSKMFKNKH